MHPSSSFLNARVSTYDPCLQLPSEPMKSLLAWMPGKCSINELSRMFCDHLPYVPGQQTAVENLRPVLPTLSFRMSQTGPKLYINLADLISESSEAFLPYFNSSFSSAEFCVTSRHSTNSHYAHDVYIGSQALRNLYTVLDFQTRRVGMVTKREPRYELSFEQCAPIANCDKEETYFEPYNSCEPPDCASYFFQELAPNGKCRFKRPFLVAVFFVFLTFGGLELLGTSIYDILIKRMDEEYPS